MPSQEEMAWKSCGALLLDRLVSWLHPGTEDRDGHSFAGPPKGESHEERQKKNRTAMSAGTEYHPANCCF